MSLIAHLGLVTQHLKKLRQILPSTPTLSTTQKVVLVSVTTGVALVGILARHFRRRKYVMDPSTFRRVQTKRSRFAGVRSPNGDVISQASSGRRSGAYSNIYGDRWPRQGSVFSSSERGSVASGSLTSGGGLSVPVPEGQPNSTQLTPQQIGVMAFQRAI